jgi:hypothetical protein
MQKPKILLAAPINIIKSYCLYDWLKAIKELSFPNLDIFLVDNSPYPAFSETIRQLGYDCVYEPPQGRESRYYMTASNERCRTKFLSGDYTHFFSLECDIFPPVDIIERLLIHDLDVVGTTYFTFQGYETQLQLLTIYELLRDFKTHNIKYETRYLSFEEAQLFMDGKCKPMYANGIGCMLIKRWVLEDIKFRVDPLDIGHADSFFARDLWANGIENYIDTSIIPVHKNSNWNRVSADTGHKLLGAKKNKITIKNR